MKAPSRAPISMAWYVAPAALYVVYIFVMGSVNLAEPPVHVSDKTMHFVAFGLMVPLFFRALRYFRPTHGRARLLALAAVLSSVAGALLELWQSFLPYRSADVLDWLADTVGAAVFAVLGLVLSRRRPEGPGPDGGAPSGSGA